MTCTGSWRLHIVKLQSLKGTPPWALIFIIQSSGLACVPDGAHYDYYCCWGLGFRGSKKSGNMASPEEDWLFNANYQNKHNIARWLSEVKLNFVFMFGFLHRSWGCEHSKTWCHMWVFQFLCLKCVWAPAEKKTDNFPAQKVNQTMFRVGMCGNVPVNGSSIGSVQLVEHFYQIKTNQSRRLVSLI